MTSQRVNLSPSPCHNVLQFVDPPPVLKYDVINKLLLVISLVLEESELIIFELFVTLYFKFKVHFIWKVVFKQPIAAAR